MNGQEPLDRLAEFYRTLDAIPTPPLALNCPGRWSYISVILAPLGASLIAYGFIACCAYMPVKPGSVPRLPMPMDRLAVDEMKADAPRTAPHQHASAEKFGGIA